MVADGITHGEVQSCAFCQGAVAQEVTVIFVAIEAYFAYIAVQPFTFLAAFPAAISAAITAVTVRSSAVEPVHHLSDVLLGFPRLVGPVIKINHVLGRKPNRA